MKNKSKADEIRKLWEKTKLVHPSYGEIARQVNSNKGYVYKVVQAHKKHIEGRI